MSLKRVAILGAGFCGVAAAYYCLKTKQYGVTLYDPVGIGGGASGIAAGLLHPFVGARGRLNPLGLEGVQETLTLLHACEEDVAYQSGLLRPATNEQQCADFSETAKHHPRTSWLSAEACQELLPGSVKAPGLWIEEAWTVDAPRYLQALWNRCASDGAEFTNTFPDLNPFDYVIITAGIDARSYAPLPLTPVKGQLFELEWPKQHPQPTVPFSSHAYLVPLGGRRMIAGATFEKKFASKDADKDEALNLLLPKLQQLYPWMDASLVVSCKAAVRASGPGHLPLVEQLDAKTRVLSGMGSRGLLYHALFARKLVETL